MATVRIKCAKCHEEFHFYGLPSVPDLNGASISEDGKEARLAIGTPDTLAAYYRASTGVNLNGEFRKDQTARENRTTVKLENIKAK